MSDSNWFHETDINGGFHIQNVTNILFISAKFLQKGIKDSRFHYVIFKNSHEIILA